jgi:predicted TPR repeat methyltransferase
MKRTRIYSNNEYLRMHPTWDAGEALLKAGWIREMIEKHKLRMREVVEVGCGSGGILAELSRQYPYSYFKGYDISAQAIALARKHEHARLEFLEADFVSWQSDVADLLLLVDVLEHIPDYYGLLESLRPRASHFMFHIPLDLSCRSLLKPQLMLQERERSGHIHYFSKEMVLWMLEDAGFEIVDWQYTKPLCDLEKPRGLKEKIRKSVRNFSFNLSREKAVKWWGGYSMLIVAK